jgi:hypothetical protein
MSLLNPFSALPLVVFLYAFVTGRMPEFLNYLSGVLGLKSFIAYRTSGFEFADAASAYWVAMVVCVVPNVVFMWWLLLKYSLANAVRKRIVDGEYPAAVKMRAYGLCGGYIRWFGWLAILVVGLICIALTNIESTRCVGCETRSVIGFLFINWFGLQSVLCLLQIGLLIVINWHLIYDQMEKKID